MDNYQRIRKIGEGAFGKAVLVRHKQTNRQCVIKEINIVRMRAKEKEDARKEVAVLAQLKHPNIVTYIESFEEAGTLYIVMNYCSGGDLYSKINSQRGVLFQEEQILIWFVQICLAIKHIHDRKILHRDIKSQNIFLSSNGTVQLGDFGIAKVLNNTAELAHSCIGTPYYLSPEIVENKPYNNKSDIWSLGCVLYELTTLKHAFEAGNMKNLVLKIIRGSYPPVSPQYSYDLRNLIGQLFKRAPRDRPSINNILRKNFVMERVRKVLSAEQIADEFSHTIMHGVKLAKALPAGPRPSSAPKRSVTPSPRPGSAGGQRRYNPAAVYGVPVGRKSQNRSSAEKKKPPPAGNRPVPIPGQQEWEQKKQNLVFKEQQRREEFKKQAEDQAARRHKELMEKQKMDRINKAREEGWRNLVDSLDSDKDKNEQAKQPSPRGDARPLPMPKQHPSPAQPSYLENRQPRAAGNYDDYLAYLDKLKNQRQERERELDQKAAAYMQAPQPVPMLNKVGGGNANNRAPAANVVQQANYDRQMGAQAAERAKIVEDYMQRRRQAAMNKARGQADLYGGRPPSARASPVPRGRPPVAQGRNREEQEYLEKLRQIREQNMKERRAIQQRAGSAGDKKEAEERRKKVEALKQQADDWAKKKKEQLERERQDLLRPGGNQGRPPSANGSRPGSAAAGAKPNVKPAPALPITGVLHVIGAGDKAAPSGAEGQAAAVPGEPEQGSVQQKKSEILKRLNEKGPTGAGRGKWGAGKEDATPAEEDGAGRGKWGAKAPSPMAVTQPESPEPESARSQWDKEEKLRLSVLPLEQTASQMEATSARDNVVKNPEDVGENPRSARNQWGRPGSTVVKALNQLPVYDGTVTLESGEEGKETPSPPTTTTSSPPAIGSTITISKSPTPTPAPAPTPSIRPPIRSGTIVIKEADKPAETTSTTATTTTTAATSAETASAGVRPVPAERLGVVGGTGNATVTVRLRPEARGPHSVAEPPSSSQPAPNAAEPLIGETELPGSNRFFESNAPPAKPHEGELESSGKLQTVPEASEDFAETGVENAAERAAENKEKLDEKSEGQMEDSLPSESVEKQLETSAARPDNDGNKAESSMPVIEQKPVIKEKPVPKEKPVLPEKLKKPDLLPKPVLLPKPEKPYEFSEEAPVVVSSANKDGKAFDKSSDSLAASKKTADKEDKPKSPEEDRSHSVQKGLCTGGFDMKNVKMLRTCSEPDLTRLFRSAVRCVQATLIRHQSLEDIQKSENAEDGDEDLLSPSNENEDDDKEGGGDANGIGNDEGGEEDDGNGDDDDDEDLISMRETMQSLLIEDDDDERENGVTSPKIQFSLSSDTEGTIKKANHSSKSSSDKESDVDPKSPEEGGNVDAGFKIHMPKSKSEPVLEHEDSDGEGTGGDRNGEEEEEEKLDYDEAELLGLNDSDDETVFGDEDEADDLDLFSRLEQQRADLEKELGFEKFVEIYKTVQALQEDEDENMEEGAKIAIKMLGPQKQHLYPRIFQLVMADTAFTEDNA